MQYSAWETFQGALIELARGASTGLIVRASVECPACSPSLVCPSCPDCICTGATEKRVVRDCFKDGGVSLAVWVCFAGALVLSFIAGRASASIRQPLSGKPIRGRGVLRNE